MRVYALVMNGVCILLLFLNTVSFAGNIREILDPEYGLSKLQYRKTIDIDYYSSHMNCDRDSESKPAETSSAPLDQETLKRKWENYKEYSLKSVGRDAKKSLFDNGIIYLTLLIIIAGHVYLYRKNKKGNL